MNIFLRWTFAIALIAASAILFNPSAGTAAPLTDLKSTDIQIPNMIEKVGRRHKKRRYRRAYYKDGYVDAPYTQVDTHNADVVVDAPYTSVRRSRRGVRVRAPFVDLYVPY